MDMAGVRDILTKSLGTANKQNSVNAAVEGLRSLTTAKIQAERRGISIERLEAK
jgi:small subunit ribosomal protein S5